MAIERRTSTRIGSIFQATPAPWEWLALTADERSWTCARNTSEPRRSNPRRTWAGSGGLIVSGASGRDIDIGAQEESICCRQRTRPRHGRFHIFHVFRIQPWHRIPSPSTGAKSIARNPRSRQPFVFRILRVAASIHLSQRALYQRRLGSFPRTVEVLRDSCSEPLVAG